MYTSMCIKCQLLCAPNVNTEYHRMSTFYVHRTNVHTWANLYKEGRSSVEDEYRPGATVTDWLRHQSKKNYAEGIRKIMHTAQMGKVCDGVERLR